MADSESWVDISGIQLGVVRHGESLLVSLDGRGATQEMLAPLAALQDSGGYIPAPPQKPKRIAVELAATPENIEAVKALVREHQLAGGILSPDAGQMLLSKTLPPSRNEPTPLNWGDPDIAAAVTPRSTPAPEPVRMAEPAHPLATEAHAPAAVETHTPVVEPVHAPAAAALHGEGHLKLPKVPHVGGSGVVAGPMAIASAAIALNHGESGKNAALQAAEGVASSIPGVGGLIAAWQGNMQEAQVRAKVDTTGVIVGGAATLAAATAGAPVVTLAAICAAGYLVTDEAQRLVARHIEGKTDVAPSMGENFVTSVRDVGAQAGSKIADYLLEATAAAQPLAEHGANAAKATHGETPPPSIAAATVGAPVVATAAGRG